MHRLTLWHKLQRPHLQALLIVVFQDETNTRPQDDLDAVKYSMDDITGRSWPFAGWKAAKHTLVLTAQTGTHTTVQSDGRSTWPPRTGPAESYNQQECDSKPPENKLTISPGSTHSLATQCGQQGCMGVALLLLEIKWRWTSGMPVARMWAPILSWDALPLQWFPEYQVLGNPPHGSHRRTAGAKPPAAAPLTSHLSAGCGGGSRSSLSGSDYHWQWEILIY